MPRPTTAAGGNGAAAIITPSEADLRRTPADATALVDPEAGVVECQTGGAENEYDYRFCRSRVDGLPDAVDFERGATGPFGRMT